MLLRRFNVYFTKIIIPVERWFRSISLDLRYFVLLPALFVLIFLQYASLTSLSESVDRAALHPSLFRFREWIKPGVLDSRIKIFAFDDQTISYMKSQDLSLKDWGKIFNEIGRKEDVKIIVDKMFADDFSESEITEFGESVSKIRPWISVIGHSYPDAIRFRREISRQSIAKNMAGLIFDNRTSPTDVGEKFPHIFGASNELLEHLTRFGHAEYTNSNDARLLIPAGQNLIVPHTALTIAHKIDVDDHQILVNGKTTHVNLSDKALVNFYPREAYRKATFAMYPVIARLKKGMDLSIIKPGDIVLILPAMYTGNTDFVTTPFGSMPGGYILAALLQSVLTETWIKALPDPGFLVLLLGFIAFFVAQKSSPAAALIKMAITGAVILLITHGVFAASNVVLSVMFPLVGMAFGTITGVIVSSVVRGLEEQRISREVEVAKLVQTSFVGKIESGSDSPMGVFGRVVPASECGGDWWGSLRKDGYSYFMIGDAIGHGVPSALVTAVAYSTVTAIRHEIGVTLPSPISPKWILEKLNATLCSMESASACMTFQVIRIHDSSGECVAANGGNLQPIMLKKPDIAAGITGKKCIRTIMARGNVLGIDSGCKFDEVSFSLGTGDRLIMYTDGLVENIPAMKSAKSGPVWLKEICVVHSGKGAEDLFDGLWASYYDRVGDNSPEDDVTIVVLANHST